MLLSVLWTLVHPKVNKMFEEARLSICQLCFLNWHQFCCHLLALDAANITFQDLKTVGDYFMRLIVVKQTSFFLAIYFNLKIKCSVHLIFNISYPDMSKIATVVNNKGIRNNKWAEIRTIHRA